MQKTFLDKLKRLNTADPARYLPLKIGDLGIGWVERDNAALLTRRAAAVFRPEGVRPNGETLRLEAGESPGDRSDRLRLALDPLVAEGLIPKRMGEMYAIRAPYTGPELFRIDRRHVPLLGLPAYGVHLNGFVRKGNGLHLWIGIRGYDRRIEPGKLDNMVAGGQPAGMSLMDNLVKECEEEAGLDEPLTRKAVSVGTLAYCMAEPRGLRNDVLYCYDLELPADFRPENRDGEIDHFELLDAREVLERVRTTDDVKFNVDAVLIDFGIRHGLITPETEPDYERLCAARCLLSYPLGVTRL